MNLNFAVAVALNFEGGFPTAATTGFRGSLTTAGSNTISAPGTYSLLDFTGTVSVNVSNVTLSNCRITGLNNDGFELDISQNLTGIVIQNCTIIGPGVSGTQVGMYGIYIEGGTDQVTITNCDISQVGTCIEVSAGGTGNMQVLIQDNYMHDLNGANGTHFETIYYGGGGGASFSLNIQHNTCYCQQSQTAGVYIENAFGTVNHITVNNNLIRGGSYALYIEGNQSTSAVGDTSPPVISNNAVQTGGNGYFNLDSGTASQYHVTESGNYDWITLAPVS